MGQPIQLLYPSEWLQESQDHQFAAIPFYDEKGVLLTSIADCWLTLYDEGAAAGEVINTLDHTSIKGTARYKFTAGQFQLTLNKDDLAIATDAIGTYTLRHVLIEFSYGSGGAKSGTQELIFVIRHVPRYPYVAP